MGNLYKILFCITTLYFLCEIKMYQNRTKSVRFRTLLKFLLCFNQL